ncbi:MAG TPA: M15 family metallopeptidase [Acidimicrobiales bacterium]|nr:M15 family metallopeptidase [Acidimicrobiales bacterium]
MPTRAVRGTAARPRDGGQATPLAAAMVAVLVVAMVSLVPMGRALVDRAHARTAADAAALAGAAEGEGAARRIAEDNHAELVAYDRDDREVTVQVRVGRVDAWARARATGRRSGFGGPVGAPGGRGGLAPAMVAALRRADALLGRPVPVASGRRTRAEQEELWERRHANPYPVARPGTSDHERGLAIDVPRAQLPAVLAVAEQAGLCRPLPRTDPVHFTICPP